MDRLLFNAYDSEDFVKKCAENNIIANKIEGVKNLFKTGKEFGVIPKDAILTTVEGNSKMIYTVNWVSNPGGLSLPEKVASVREVDIQDILMAECSLKGIKKSNDIDKYKDYCLKVASNLYSEGLYAVNFSSSRVLNQYYSMNSGVKFSKDCIDYIRLYSFNNAQNDSVRFEITLPIVEKGNEEYCIYNWIKYMRTYLKSIKMSENDLYHYEGGKLNSICSLNDYEELKGSFIKCFDIK